VGSKNRDENSLKILIKTAKKCMDFPPMRFTLVYSVLKKWKVTTVIKIMSGLYLSKQNKQNNSS